MSQHLKRGLIAFLIAFGVVAIYGAMDIFFDPPVDVPSVAYFAYWLLVKAVLAIGIGFGLSVFAVVVLISWALNRPKKALVIVGCLLMTFSLTVSALIYLTKKKPTDRDEGYSHGEVKCCVPHR